MDLWVVEANHFIKPSCYVAIISLSIKFKFIGSLQIGSDIYEMLIKGLQLAIAEPKTLTLLKFGFVSLCLFAEASLITEMF